MPNLEGFFKDKYGNYIPIVDALARKALEDRYTKEESDRKYLQVGSSESGELVNYDDTEIKNDIAKIKDDVNSLITGEAVFVENDDGSIGIEGNYITASFEDRMRLTIELLTAVRDALQSGNTEDAVNLLGQFILGQGVLAE